jgi:hypothetical protein
LPARQVGASIQQLTSDATAIGELENANSSPVLLAINDTALDVQAGLSTLAQDAGETASITASNGPLVVSAATFLADQSTLDKIVGGFEISDTAPDVAQDLDPGGQLIRQKSVNSDGSYDIGYFDVTGEPYSSYEAIYNTAATLAADAQNDANGAGTLLLYASGLTISSSPGSDSVTVGSDTFAITPQSNETTTVENSKTKETFIFGAGFGQGTISGFLATTTSHDVLQFSASMFGFSAASSRTADAQALLSKFAGGTTNTVITDQSGDSLPLNGVTVATLKGHLGNFMFT